MERDPYPRRNAPYLYLVKQTDNDGNDYQLFVHVTPADGVTITLKTVSWESLTFTVVYQIEKIGTGPVVFARFPFKLPSGKTETDCSVEVKVKNVLNEAPIAFLTILDVSFKDLFQQEQPLQEKAFNVPYIHLRKPPASSKVEYHPFVRMFLKNYEPNGPDSFGAIATDLHESIVPTIANNDTNTVVYDPPVVNAYRYEIASLNHVVTFNAVVAGNKRGKTVAKSRNADSMPLLKRAVTNRKKKR